MQNITLVIMALSLSAAQCCIAADVTPQAKATAHIHNYSAIHPTCIQWTDDCRSCDESGCSNIGIACQPNEVRCIERKSSGVEESQPPDKK